MRFQSWKQTAVADYAAVEDQRKMHRLVAVELVDFPVVGTTAGFPA